MLPISAAMLTRSSESARPTSNGHPLRLARAAWVLVVAGMLGLVVLGLPNSFAIMRTVSPATRAGLASLGLSADLVAVYFVLLDALIMLAFTGLASLIVWRRSGDPMVMFVGLMLVLTGALYTAPMYEAPAPLVLIAGVCALAEICQVAFVFLFPDGRFVPRWSWLLLLPLVGWRPAIWAFVYLPDYQSMARSGDTYGFLPQDALDLALLMALFLAGIGCQVYRYRRHSTPIQRQQTRWLLYGVISAVVVVGAYTIGLNALGFADAHGHQALLARLAGRTVRGLALLLVPITLAYSILRYRLWQIDTLINRTLIYGTLTGLLVAIYVGSVVLLQAVFRALTGQESNLAIVLSTLAAAALFLPLRSRVQAVINRRFYRQTYDAAQLLAAFSASLSDEVELQKLSEDLVAVVAEAMQPDHVSLWIRRERPARDRLSS